jgi:hypothetical protein
LFDSPSLREGARGDGVKNILAQPYSVICVEVLYGVCCISL